MPKQPSEPKELFFGSFAEDTIIGRLAADAVVNEPGACQAQPEQFAHGGGAAWHPVLEAEVIDGATSSSGDNMICSRSPRVRLLFEPEGAMSLPQCVKTAFQ